MICNSKMLTLASGLAAAICLNACAKAPKKMAGLRLIAKIGVPPNLDYQIVNDGEVPATVGIMSCSANENWSTDNPAVNIVAPVCTRNGCIPHTIQKLDVFRGTLLIEHSKGTKAIELFRLHFKGCEGMPQSQTQKKHVDELWSDTVQLGMK